MNESISKKMSQELQRNRNTFQELIDTTPNNSAVKDWPQLRQKIDRTLYNVETTDKQIVETPFYSN